MRNAPETNVFFAQLEIAFPLLFTRNIQKKEPFISARNIFLFFIIGFLWENQQKMHFTLKFWCFISFSLEWKKRRRKIAKFNNSLLLISPTYDLLPQNCYHCCKKIDVNNKWQKYKHIELISADFLQIAKNRKNIASIWFVMPNKQNFQLVHTHCEYLLPNSSDDTDNFLTILYKWKKLQNKNVVHALYIPWKFYLSNQDVISSLTFKWLDFQAN